MADKIVCNIVTNLSHFLANELRLLFGVDEQIQSLRTELEYINNFLRNSEGKHDEHGNEMVLVTQIREIAHEAEHVVNTYDVNVANNRPEQNMWPELFGLFNRAIEAHKVAHKIGEIRRKFSETEEKNSRYGKLQKEVNESDGLLQKSKKRVEENDVNEAEESQKRSDKLEKRRRRVEENDVVGFDKEAKTLVDQLLGGTKELDIISISGMGGLGKSTLAKKVYNDRSVKQHFTRSVWVSVSKEFKLKQLLGKMLEEVTRMTTDQTTRDKVIDLKLELERQSALDVEQLKQELVKKLSQYRYLVVLDDIWRSEDWDELEEVFPHSENGSRIILTTRSKEVALHASGNTPVLLQIRDADQSWELFTKKVFRRGCCPKNLESTGKEIVEKCGGLPIAIVVIGGLLASKDKTNPIWDSILESIDRYIQPDTLDILGLSYSDLHPCLQPCFLYMRLFPEDHKIHVRRLIQLWIAEGFIQEVNGTRMEVVAEDYLQQLVDRSLVQVEERRTDGGIKTCSLHDLTRDLCVNLCMEDNSSQNKPMRRSIHYSRRDNTWNAFLSNSCHIRTLLCFDQHKLPEQDWQELFKRFELLEVLELEDGALHGTVRNNEIRRGNRRARSITQGVQRTLRDRLLQDIGRLHRLKYLRVKSSEFISFPKSVFNLQNIQTIDLRAASFHELPREIWKMHQLRHLYLPLHGVNTLPKAESEDCTLLNLQTLSYIEIYHADIFEKAPNLRKLGLSGFAYYLFNGLVSNFPPHLQSIKFAGDCNLKQPIKLPATITKITFKGQHLIQNIFDMFGGLQNLRILKFEGTHFHDDKLVFEKSSFPQLQLLKFESSNIRTWELQEEAMPNLHHLIINECPLLVEVPERLWKVNTLQKLELYWAPSPLVEKLYEHLKENEGFSPVIQNRSDAATGCLVQYMCWHF